MREVEARQRGVKPVRLVLLGILVVVYALCYSAIKVGLEFAPPLFLGGLTAGLGGIIILTILAAVSRGVGLPRNLLTGTIVLALVGTTLQYGAMFMAPGRTGAGIASVLGNTGPLFLVFLGSQFLGERVTKPKAEAVVLGGFGVALIAYPALVDPGLSGSAAVLFPLGAAAGAASSSVLLKRLRVGSHLLPVTGWQLVLGAIPLLLLSALVEDGSAIQWNSPFPALLVFLAAVGTAGGLSAWYWLVQREEVGRLGIFLFAVPVVGLAIAWLLFGERIQVRELAGVLIILFGIVRLGAGHPTEPQASGS
ncbi:MAG: EamA family transporter [Gemmatimonadota bacterium]